MFFSDKLIFLGFVISTQGVGVDEEKVKAIGDWPTFKIVSEIRSFYGLASFCRRFMKYFSSVTAFLNKLVKKWLEWKSRKSF